VPLLNLRVARPARLVDINAAGLGVIRRSGGTLRIGATVRQAALERSALVARHWPLLAQAARHVGHPATRSRGTVGGSVAHADPAAELPVALTALAARYVVRGPRGTRTVTEFFEGPLTTALAPGELLVSIDVPALPPGARTAFAEIARTHGDFAQAGAAVVLADGQAAVALLGTGSHPIRAAAAEVALREGASAREAAALAATEVEGGHRRALVAEVTRRALVEAGRA
jgi:CO/xanthine dehydrogenase FAD-binding subunit